MELKQYVKKMVSCGLVALPEVAHAALLHMGNRRLRLNFEWLDTQGELSIDAVVARRNFSRAISDLHDCLCNRWVNNRSHRIQWGIDEDVVFVAKALDKCIVGFPDCLNSRRICSHHGCDDFGKRQQMHKAGCTFAFVV